MERTWEPRNPLMEALGGAAITTHQGPTDPYDLSPPLRPSRIPDYLPPNSHPENQSSPTILSPPPEKRLSLIEFNNALSNNEDTRSGNTSNQRSKDYCCCCLIHHSKKLRKGHDTIKLFGKSFVPGVYESLSQCLYLFFTTVAIITCLLSTVISTNEFNFDREQPDESTNVTKCKGFHVQHSNKNTWSKTYTLFNTVYGIIGVVSVAMVIGVSIYMNNSRNTDQQILSLILKDPSTWLVLGPVIVTVSLDIFVGDVVSLPSSLLLFVQILMVLFADTLVYHVSMYEVINYVLLVFSLSFHLLRTYVLSRDDILIACLMGDPISVSSLKRICFTSLLLAVPKPFINLCTDPRRLRLRWIEEPIFRSIHMSKATLEQRNIARKISQATQRRLSRDSRRLQDITPPTSFNSSLSSLNGVGGGDGTVGGGSDELIIGSGHMDLPTSFNGGGYSNSRR
tara:strand:- start:1178 stop:2536 length:1359 start_codon:yes stop_codon:yes gene_type:complete